MPWASFTGLFFYARIKALFYLKYPHIIHTYPPTHSTKIPRCAKLGAIQIY